MPRAHRLLIVIALLASVRTSFAADPTPAEVKAAFLKLLDRPRVPLDVEVVRVDRPLPGYAHERVSFASEAGQRVPALVTRPDEPGKKHPAVILLHGTGGNKDGMRPFLEELAKRGFVAIAIDGRYHGDRAKGAKGAEEYNRAIVRAWRSPSTQPQEHPFYYDTCWDVWRTVDYLQSRPDVDPDRIGLLGISKGGIETYLAAAVDDRIKAAIPAISVQSFAWELDHDRWQGRANTIAVAHQAAARDLNEPKVNAKVCRALWDKVVPGITSDYDCPSMLRLFAGRPLLILNGSEDPNCPIEGAKLACASAAEAFKAAGSPEKLKIMIAEGVGHKVTDEQHAAAVEWLVRWLKP